MSDYTNRYSRYNTPGYRNSTTKKLYDSSFIHSRLQIYITFKGDFNSASPIQLSSKMINPQQPVKREGYRLFFSQVIEYSDKLLKEALVEKNLDTFTDPNEFKKIILYGTKKQKVPKYKT